jgi:hypothetical protein
MTLGVALRGAAPSKNLPTRPAYRAVPGLVFVAHEIH